MTDIQNIVHIDGLQPASRDETAIMLDQTKKANYKNFVEIDHFLGLNYIQWWMKGRIPPLFPFIPSLHA